MKPVPAIALLAALGCVAAAVIWWRGDSQPLDSGSVQEATEKAAARTGPLAESEATFGKPQPADSARGGTEVEPRGAAPTMTAIRRGSRSLVERAAGSTGHPFAWPTTRARRAANADTGPTAEPVVPVKVAFRALWYLGVDPEAERTWTRAINDPSSPPGVRSDLIVDMIDEGYSDNSHPTAEDLPVILARLEIIERHAPYAMDEINARAFEEAYRHLLEMYVRLGGEPRGGR